MKEKRKLQILFTDLDGTLTETISGEDFPKGIWDMKLKFEVLDKIKELNPEIICIVSNQGGIGKGFVNPEHFKIKMNYVAMSIMEYTRITVLYDYIPDDKDKNRKPSPYMLNKFSHLLNIIPDDCMMIGDASGKEGDFSDSDKKAAENFGCKYMDVNDFIKGQRIMKG